MTLKVEQYFIRVGLKDRCIESVKLLINSIIIIIHGDSAEFK